FAFRRIMTMAEAFIVDAVRTPIGRRNGGLAKIHPADLGAHALRALVERTKIDPAAVDDVVFGCVDAIGPPAGGVARTCWVGAKGWIARYGDQPVSQFRSAEMIAEKWKLSRGDMEAFALESHRRAIAAQDAGWFAGEIAPIGAVAADEGPRRDTSLAKMQTLA